VIGTSTYLDSLRFRVHLAERFAVSPACVEANVVGEHGTSSVFLWSSAQIGGMGVADALAKRGSGFDIFRREVEWNRTCALPISRSSVGSAESIDGGRVDDIDAMLQRGTDGGNRFSFIGSAPHPPANGPGADRDGRHLERCAGNVAKLHVHFESFGLTSHDPAPSSSACG
jgi:hypothetical protein